MDVTFDSVDKRNLPYNQKWMSEIPSNDTKYVKFFFSLISSKWTSTSFAIFSIIE